MFCQALHYNIPFTMISNPRSLDFSIFGTSCTEMPGAENRGISLEQLQQLRRFLQSHSNDGGWLPWRDLAPIQYSRTSGLRLNTRTINLYQAQSLHLTLF